MSVHLPHSFLCLIADPLQGCRRLVSIPACIVQAKYITDGLPVYQRNDMQTTQL